MKGLFWIFAVAILWAITGALAGWGLQALLGGDNWILPCGSLNMAIGMILLLLVTQNEAARKLFYEGEKKEDRLHLYSALFETRSFPCVIGLKNSWFQINRSIGIVLLWGFPIILAVSGILWFLASKLFPP